jgi:hypothetical protein
MGRINKTRRLLTVDGLLEMSVKKGVLYIQLMNRCYGHGLAGIGRGASRSICLGCSSFVGSWGRDWINSSSLIDYLNTLPPFI